MRHYGICESGRAVGKSEGAFAGFHLVNPRMLQRVSRQSQGKKGRRRQPCTAGCVSRVPHHRSQGTGIELTTTCRARHISLLIYMDAAGLPSHSVARTIEVVAKHQRMLYPAVVCSCRVSRGCVCVCVCGLCVRNMSAKLDTRRRQASRVSRLSCCACP